MKKWTYLTYLMVTVFLALSLLLGGCTKKQYSLTIAVSGQGTTTPSAGTYTYKDGQSLTVTATPASGWKFDGWSGDVSGEDASITIRMDGKKDIAANFSTIKYNLTLAVIGSGTTSPAAGSRAYDAGTVVNLTAMPASGWKFDNWSGDASGNSPTVTLRMDSKKGITANFSKITYNLNIIVNGNGTTSPVGGTHAYDASSVISVTATPDTGWKFDGWSGDTTGSNPTVSVTMDRPKNINANFSRITYILTLAVKGNGSTNPTVGGHAYDAGTTVNIGAMPDSGWRFDRWTGDVAGTSSTLTVVMNSDKMVTANFMRPPITIGPESWNIGTSPGDYSLVYLNPGDQVDFNFTAAGSLVYYSVKDPNGNTILNGSGGVKVASGQGSFVAVTGGIYKLHFVSSGILTPSVLTISYTVSYPVP
jgi:uncharacterized repeat protein (TIGR02543 family)